MKTLPHWLTLGLVAFTATIAVNASAGQPAADRPEKHWTGTITYVSPADRVLKLKNWTSFQKNFNLAENCVYALWEKGDATPANLRPGQKVIVSYQDAHGVLIASRIEQEPLRLEGMVVAIDPGQHQLTMHQRGLDRTVQIAAECQVILHGSRAGALTDLQAGSYVTVTYETPGGTLTARQIEQTSQTFTGTLTAIDLGEKTLKAKTAFDTKKFNVADHCAIVMNGRLDGRLADLKPNDKLVLHFDEINGVNVVNWIAPAGNAPATKTTGSQPSGS